MAYELHFNLTQLSIFRVAISFWENKKVNEKVVEFFKPNSDCSLSKWHRLVKEILADWNEYLFPKDLEIEVLHVIRRIGEMMYSWRWYACQQGVDLQDWMNKIHWTPYGTIDECKTLKSASLLNPTLETTRVYKLPCEFTSEDHINDLWHGILKEGKVDTNNRQPDDNCRQIYWKFGKDSQIPDAMEQLKTILNEFTVPQLEQCTQMLDRCITKEQTMLWVAVHQGNYNAMIHFWEMLSKERKYQSAALFSRVAVIRYQDVKSGIKHDYQVRQYTEICVFMMKHMSATQRESLYNERVGDTTYVNNLDVRNNILQMLLTSWPWQELFIPVLEDICKHYDRSREMNCEFLDSITWNMYIDHKSGCPLEKNKYRKLFREAWSVIPADIKKKIKRKTINRNFISDLVDRYDIKSLQLIFHDPEVKENLDSFIKLALDSLHWLRDIGGEKKLDYMLERILESKDVREEVKQKIDEFGAQLSKTITK